MASPGRKKNVVESSSFQITTTRPVSEDLERLARSGYFGKNASETAEMIIRERIRELRRSEPGWFSD